MTKTVELKVPDIGDFEEVEVIELLIDVGDRIEIEQSLITLESDKASLEIPASSAGIVRELRIVLGDKVSEGDVIAVLDTDASESTESQPTKPAQTTGTDNRQASTQIAEKTPARPSDADSLQHPVEPAPQPSTSPTAHLETHGHRPPHASPGVRRYARQLGADIHLIKGSGRKNRILKEDVKSFIKNALEHSVSAYKGGGNYPGGGGPIPPVPEVDFSKFGETERTELGRIQKLSAANLHRSWLNLPMVTHHDEADITDMESFRQSLKEEAEQQGIRVTGLAFHMKALAASLKAFPKFNASLSPDGQALFLKKYFHIGIAVDTPDGLVVPVFRDVDKKSVYELAEEMADISERARAKKLKPEEMQGGCMTISSLGGIGGTAFTPIVNAPEVAILGITRARMQAIWNGETFTPRLMCPLDLTYDHRVIDGADAARFLASYCNTISDIRRLTL